VVPSESNNNSLNTNISNNENSLTEEVNSENSSTEGVNSENSSTEEVNRVSIILTYENKNRDTLNTTFSGFENLIRTKFEEFLVSTPEFKLNNTRNVKDGDDKELNNKRFQILGGNLVMGSNTCEILLNLRKYSVDYEEIPNSQLKTELQKFINKHKINLGDDQKYWEMLLVKISGYNMKSFSIEDPIEYKDPKLLKDTEIARKLLRGRFEDDFIDPTYKTTYARSEEDTKATMSGFIKLSELSK